MACVDPLITAVSVSLLIYCLVILQVSGVSILAVSCHDHMHIPSYTHKYVHIASNIVQAHANAHKNMYNYAHTHTHNILACIHTQTYKHTPAIPATTVATRTDARTHTTYTHTA